MRPSSPSDRHAPGNRMNHRILTVAINSEHDVVEVRRRARHLAQLLRFGTQDQARIATAVSEIARNAFAYAGGGRAEFVIETETAPALSILIKDCGKGIPNLPEILAGGYQSSTGLGMGILGARRLLDRCDIETKIGLGRLSPLKNCCLAQFWSTRNCCRPSASSYPPVR